MFLVVFFGRLPRLFGLVLVGAYGYFVYKGLINPG
jgi:hypothetical protein